MYQKKLLLHLKTPHELDVDLLRIQNCCLKDSHCKSAYGKILSIMFRYNTNLIENFFKHRRQILEPT